MKKIVTLTALIPLCYASVFSVSHANTVHPNTGTVKQNYEIAEYLISEGYFTSNSLVNMRKEGIMKFQSDNMLKQSGKLNAETRNFIRITMEKMETPNIVATAVSVPELSTLVAAVKAGELVDTLSSEGPFTVFAPVNTAFAKIPADTLNSLLTPEKKADLVNILTYHVVAGNALSTDLSDGQEITTVQGTKLKVTIKDGKVFINDAQVITADVKTSNGTVHLIDTVLMPK